MPHYVITPWRNESELLEVKQGLFGLGTTNPDVDAKQHAMDRIAAWRLRGKLPHAVNSTALLIEAQLHHSSGQGGPFSIQATYSAAFCRFVTGYCDISMSNVSRRSMHDVAEELGMPASWVDLRHEATHGQLPSIVMLEKSVASALLWLQENYWEQLEKSKQNDDPEEPAIVDDDLLDARLDKELRIILSTFLRRRVAEVKAGADATASDSASSAACLDVIKLCRGQVQKLEVLAGILVQEKMLVPTDRAPRDPLTGAYLLWTTLLRTLSYYQTLFLDTLLKRMLAILTEPNYLYPPPDAFREAVCEWCLHVVVSLSSNSPSDACELKSLVVSECIMAPRNQWTAALTKQLVLGAKDVEFRQRWEPYLVDDETG